jgi:1-acyl-sn-glycerol-3-phosphate acyltransferase
MDSFPKIRFLTTWFVLLYWRTKVYGAENIPSTGPFLVVANHASHLDPFLIDWASKKRELYFMAKEELFRNPFFGWFLGQCNAFPVKRGVRDEAAIKNFHDILGSGKPVGLFPEGTRTLDGETQPGKKGSGMLVYNARVPVIPVYIAGTFRCFPKGKLWPRPGETSITFGPALSLEDLYREKAEKPTYRKIADRLMENIARLRPKA